MDAERAAMSIGEAWNRIDDLEADLAAAQAQVAVLRQLMPEIERNCPCGARPESPNTHPHVTACPVAKAVAVLAASPAAALEQVREQAAKAERERVLRWIPEALDEAYERRMLPSQIPEYITKKLKGGE